MRHNIGHSTVSRVFCSTAPHWDFLTQFLSDFQILYWIWNPLPINSYNWQGSQKNRKRPEKFDFVLLLCWYSTIFRSQCSIIDCDFLKTLEYFGRNFWVIICTDRINVHFFLDINDLFIRKCHFYAFYCNIQVMFHIY